MYAPPPTASTQELRSLWTRTFGAANTLCNDAKKARRIADNTLKRLSSDADGRKSPGSVIVGSKRAWNAVNNAARASHVRVADAKRIADAVSGKRFKSVHPAVLTVLRVARAKGLL